jgi:hypothetical protein
VFQSRFFPLKAAALFEGPADDETVFQKIVKYDHGTRGIRGQRRAGLLAAENIQGAHNSYMHGHHPICE